MNKALYDVSFHSNYPHVKNDKNRLWLLLYDLHLRNFRNREPKEQKRQYYMYEEADLNDLYSCIWLHKVNLAAAISRLRIQNRALKLSELLPIHLQDEKVGIAVINPIITGWINPFKIRTKTKALELFSQNGFLEVRDTEYGELPISLQRFKYDKACPLFISCIPTDRRMFHNSDLVKCNKLILQDRAFSIGPALFSYLLHYFEIDGDVVQTHVSSPKSTAYLAALFSSNNRVKRFFAFGAGENTIIYNDYMKTLGIDNVRIYSENFCRLPLDAQLLDTVVAIFATPPNSYSGVVDPIDLICSRGGDLSMLEVLTESEMSNDGKQRVGKILQAQRETLRMSMARPQVQFVLYETHSTVGSENEIMVKRAIKDINREAYAKHVKIHKDRKRLEALAEQEGLTIDQLEKLQGSLTANLKLRKSTRQEDAPRKYLYDSDSSAHSDTESEQLDSSRSKRSNQTSSDEFCHIKVPRTDVFETVDIPDMCLYRDNCMKHKVHGCFLSVLKRKHITRLDEKYLILMAERRGLFADSSPKKLKIKPQIKVVKIEERKSSSTKKVKRRKSEDVALLAYINQPISRCKIWWIETIQFLKSSKILKSSDACEVIYENIKNNRTDSLKLSRTQLPTSSHIGGKRSASDRSSYPLIKNSVEFHEYRLQSSSSSNKSLEIKIQNYLRRPCTSKTYTALDNFRNDAICSAKSIP